jgi:hypothetical protein
VARWAIPPLIFVITSCVALSYPLPRWLAGQRVGLMASLLVALAPFHIAQSRVLHPDPPSWHPAGPDRARRGTDGGCLSYSNSS